MEISGLRLAIDPVAGVLIVLMLTVTGVISHNFNAKYVPSAAIEFIKNEDIKGNMFNNDEFGDSIIYAAWPQRMTAPDPIDADRQRRR